MPALPYSITISDEERAYLKSLIKTRTIQAQVVDRARMLLQKSEAKTDKAIADGLGVSVNTVRRCIDRYLNNGINLAIFDDERSGRPAEITDDAKYPEGDTIRLILDNHSAHTSKETRQFLAVLPEDRFVFVFTPTHTSWLNMIESFFSKMTKQMLKGIRVNSKEELSERIYRYFDEINADPIVYHWTYKYKMDEIDPDEVATI